MTETQARVYQYLVESGNIESSREIARKLNVNKDTVLEVRKRLGVDEDFDKLSRLQAMIAPKLVVKTKFEGDGVITADHHNPCADLRVVRAVCEASEEFNIKRLFDIGDFFNFDALSVFARKMNGDANLPRIKEEIEVGYEVLKMYSEYFDEIYLLEGNHDARFARCVSNELTFDMIIKSLQLPKVKLINSNYIYLDDTRLTHPRSYRQTKLSVADALTLKFMEPVLQAHGHFATFGFAKNGLPCGDIPCVCDPDRVVYLQGGDTTHPFWNQGFIIYKDGQRYPRAKGWGLKI